MIRAVFFDFDGVICDTEPIYFDFKLDKMKRMGLEITRQRLLKYVGESFKAVMQKEYSMENKEELIQEYYHEFNQLVIDYKKYAAPNLVNFLEFCRQREINCYICSNSLPERLEEALYQLNIKHYFKQIFTSASLGVAKPDPQFYYQILKETKLSANEVVVLEDSNNGIQTAINAGIVTIAKKEYYLNIDQSKADYHFDNFNELPSILNKMTTE